MKEVFTKMKSSNIDCDYLNGIYKDIADMLGIEVALKLHTMYRGQQITFPVHFHTKDFIANQIVSEFDGHNAKRLASKFGYSEKWIRKIIKEYNK